VPAAHRSIHNLCGPCREMCNRHIYDQAQMYAKFPLCQVPSSVLNPALGRPPVAVAHSLAPVWVGNTPVTRLATSLHALSQAGCSSRPRPCPHTHSLHSLLCTSSFAGRSPVASAARAGPCRPQVGDACAASAVRRSQVCAGGCGPCQPGSVTAPSKAWRVGSSRKLSSTTWWGMCRGRARPSCEGM
jgi:hypothetical protein